MARRIVGYSLLLAGCLCLGPLRAARGQLPMSGIEDFRIPEYDEEGRLKWVLQGDSAQMIPEDGRVHIKGVRVEIYRDGKVDMVLRAPECDYSQDRKRAWTDGPVEITARNLTIRGRGMDWESGKSAMSLDRDVHVTVLNPREGMAPEPETQTDENAQQEESP